jgi:hypothetical protein
MKSQIIAQAQYLWSKSDGASQTIHIRIGLPFEGDNCWECELDMASLRDKTTNICGENSIQALSLAVAFAETMLANLIERGELISFPSEPEEYLTLEMFPYRRP